MSEKYHEEFHKEERHLKKVKKKIKKTLSDIIENENKYRQDMKQAMIDLDYLDSSQSYITILTTAKLMDIDKENMIRLSRTKNKPYFSRIDFTDQESEFTKEYYIGKAPLMDQQNHESVIIDWRSPIANLYYEGRLGEVSYQSPQGEIHGDLSLKRQFMIEEGELNEFYDIDITTTDTFLQASVSAHAESRLKDIAATIQSEQNKIIRADSERPLIIQGVAGSGKTTIALHRIAYLIYQNEEKFSPENYVIIAPNSLFLNYISDVLPDLGVERILQTTFEDFIYKILGQTYKVTGKNQSLIKQIEKEKETTKEPMADQEMAKEIVMIGFKGTLDYKRLLDAYISDLEKEFVPKKDFLFHGHPVIGHQEIDHLFTKEYAFLPLYKRKEAVKKVISNRLKSVKPHIIEQTIKDYNQKIDKIRREEEDGEEKRQNMIAMIEEREATIARLKKPASAAINKFLDTFPKKDLLHYYSDLLTDADKIMHYAAGTLDKQRATFFAEHTKELLSRKLFAYEDLAALTWLNHRLYGQKKETEISHVIIDEAQDLNMFEIFVLKTLLRTKRFTILGDLAQGIHAHRGINDWQVLADTVFVDDQPDYLTLVQSYRTTVEIMDYANKIIKKADIPGLIPANPVIRHGSEPEIQTFYDAKSLLSELAEQIRQREDIDPSIALICKTEAECKKIKEALEKEDIIAERLTGNEEAYEAGIVILPSYVAKGLEFDTVFILETDQPYLDTELDHKLLYVAATRAMHHLAHFKLKGTRTSGIPVGDIF